MFSTERKFSKTIKSILTGKEVKRRQKYILPQFGPSPAKSKETTYTDEEATVALQEAVNYFGVDAIVRHLNWSITVAAQRKANNDLRTATAGLDASTQARVTLITNIAKRAAESEVGDFNDKGELVVDRKSDAYVLAMRESLKASLAKPKFADLEPIFKGADESGEELTVDLMLPGSLNDQSDDDAETDESEPAADSSVTEPATPAAE